LEKLKEKLKEVFGYSQFRGNQEAVIRYLMEGKNTFVIMPTGAGKSLCYQLPALLHEGTAIVISPLIALMKNQVDQLTAFGVNARFLNSTLTKGEIKKVRKETLAGEIKLLYVAPESLTKEENIELLKQSTISFAAIDEAHCISEWGHDFRPEYRKIKSILDEIGKMPLIALTATATLKVQQDIKKNLEMDDADVFLSSFNRKNLYYEIRPKVHVKKQLIKFIKDHKGKSGIIYCLSRKKVEEIAGLLQVNDIKASPYHAGLEPSVRARNQDNFLNEEIDVIVATIAFGMGIDKPDVRFVIHYDVPKSLEGYYQETGRSGRDGLEGNCILFYRYKDILKLEKFQKDKSVTERENALLLLDEMSMYAESSVCRRKQLLHYFGEIYDESECGKTMWCDVCKYPPEKYDGKEHVLLVLNAAIQTEERFGLKHLSDVITGVENQYVLSYKHNKVSSFAKGKGEKQEEWNSVIRQTLLHHYLEKDLDNIGVLKVTDLGKEFVKNPHSITLVKDKDFESLIEQEDKEPHILATSYDETLFELLKKLRKDVARQKNLPPYVVFHDPSLEEMATVYPTTKEELAQINGVGMGKISKFGKPFLELIQEYVDENDIITASDVVVKSAVNKSKTKIFIIQQIDRKIDLQEIADAKGISFADLIDEIENICYSGTKLNLDYYVENILDSERQDEVFDYFMNSHTDKISDVLDEFEEEEYDEEDIRLLRVKFLSDHAN
jgi:ATP-dependent DNA helicase RecQ